jgi:histone-lysine N-methyltransferase EZH2
MKTCWDVFQYMNCSESKLSCQVGDGANSLVEGYSKVGLNGTVVSALLCLSISC